MRACYVGSEHGVARASGRQNTYLLSGILRCALCGAAMTIHAGTSAAYYRCSDAKKRGTCPNRGLGDVNYILPSTTIRSPHRLLRLNARSS